MAKSFIFLIILLLITACSSSAPLSVSEDNSSIQQSSSSSTLPANLEATPLKVDNKTIYIISPSAPQETAVLSNSHLFLYDNQSKAWRTELKNENVLSNMSFRYNPKQVKDIPMQGTL